MCISVSYRLVQLTVRAFGAGGSVADDAAFVSIGLVDSKVRLGACVGSFQAHFLEGYRSITYYWFILVS